MLDSVLDYRNALAKRVKKLENVLEKSPEGSLVINRRGSHSYYSHRTTVDGSRISRYISRDDIPRIKQLAQKYYAASLLPGLKKNLKAAEAFIRLHSGTEELDQIDKYTPDLLIYCGDLYTSRDDVISEWLNSKGPEEPSYERAPEIATADGNMVRSKSEALIYNSLLANSKAFLYEKALYFKNRSFPVFPDFTILDPSTMQELYWEHFGLMDDPDYLDRALEKISVYNQNGIIPGKTLICTFESRNRPLSSADVERIVRTLPK